VDRGRGGVMTSIARNGIRSSGGFVLWSIYTPLKQEYTAFVAWLRDRCVKAQELPALLLDQGSLPSGDQATIGE
jgi:hypothetical protein